MFASVNDGLRLGHRGTDNPPPPPPKPPPTSVPGPGEPLRRSERPSPTSLPGPGRKRHDDNGPLKRGR